MSKIKNLIFDFGGIIVDTNKNRSLEHFRQIGFTDIQSFLDNYRQKGFFLQLESGTITRDEFYEKINEHCGKLIAPSDIDKAWLSFIEGVDPQKLAILKELRKSYKLFVLSNLNPIVASWAQSSEFSPTKEVLDDFFEKLYLSYEIKMAKPDPEIYRYVLSDSGIDPSETLFIDDSRANLEASEREGIQGFHIESNSNWDELLNFLNFSH